MGTVAAAQGPKLRRAAASDREAIWRFLEEAYPDPERYRARWEWEFVQNPFAHEPDGKLPIWLAVEEANGAERIVGQMAALPIELKVGEERRRAAWLVDLVVLPPWRRLGIGQRLHDALGQHYGLVMKLTMAEATRRMARKSSSVDLAPVPLYSRLVCPDADAVRRYLLTRTRYHARAQALARASCDGLQLHRALAPLLRTAVALRRRPGSSPSAGPAPEVAEVPAFGEEIDELWARTCSQFPVAAQRDTRFLNWRFSPTHPLRYDRFVARDGNGARGYLVLRRSEPQELPLGIIADLYAGRSDTATVHALVQRALERFGETAAAVVCATTVPAHQAVLARLGFRRGRQQRPTCVSYDPRLRARLAELRNDWFLTKADHDWDQLMPASGEGRRPARGGG